MGKIENRHMISSPLVTILIPVRNEQLFINDCLDSILSTNYDIEKLEIFIIDGKSDDQTLEIVSGYILKYPQIFILDNPDRIQAAALNIGIKHAKGDIIIRMDAHTLYDPAYISECVRLLTTRNVANVGGVQTATGTNYVSKAIALATSSMFGAGNAYFRYADKEMFVDTVYLGAWKKETLKQVGGYRNDWAINEDYELNYRIRKSGGKILLSPAIKCQYFVRGSISKLTKQYFKYGMWKTRTFLLHPQSLKMRQIIPPVFITGVLLSIILLALGSYWGLILPAIYLGANLLSTIKLSLKSTWLNVFILPIIFIIIHFAWGIGFWTGLLKFGLFYKTRNL